MKKKFYLIALTVSMLGTLSVIAAEVPGGSDKGCVSRPGENNGKCTSVATDEGTTHFCADTTTEVNCVKAVE